MPQVRAMPTHNFSMGPLPNYYEREYGNGSYNGTWYEHIFFLREYLYNIYMQIFLCVFECMYVYICTYIYMYVYIHRDIV